MLTQSKSSQIPSIIIPEHLVVCWSQIVVQTLPLYSVGIHRDMHVYTDMHRLHTHASTHIRTYTHAHTHTHTHTPCTCTHYTQLSLYHKVVTLKSLGVMERYWPYVPCCSSNDIKLLCYSTSCTNRIVPVTMQ